MTFRKFSEFYWMFGIVVFIDSWLCKSVYIQSFSGPFFRHLAQIGRFTIEKIRNNTERIRRMNTRKNRPETYWDEPVSHKRIWNTNKLVRCSILQKRLHVFNCFCKRLISNAWQGSEYVFVSMKWIRAVENATSHVLPW